MILWCKVYNEVFEIALLLINCLGKILPIFDDIFDVNLG